MRAYSASEVIIGERVLRSSLIVSATELIVDWPPRSVAELIEDHLVQVFALGAELVLLGTGMQQVFPAPRILAAAARAGVGLEVMDTPAACRTYNVLLNEERRVAAALMLGRV